MRVLVATQSFDRPEEAVYLGLSRLGHHVTIACRSDAPRQQHLADAGIEVHHLNARHRLDRNASELLSGLMAQRRTEIVYASSNRTLAAALRATLGTRIPIAAYRGTTGHISRLDPASWLTFLHPRLARIACVSNAVRDYLASRGIADSKLTTLYKGHDPGWYSNPAPIDLRDLGIPPEASTVAFAGAIRSVKGIPFLLEAMQHVPDELNAHLLLVGEVRDGQTRRRINIAGPRCHSLGHRDDAISLIAACDLFVMPSVSREGLPRAVIEAMCLQKPSVVTNVGGMPELVEDGSCGRVLPPRDPQALAAAITELLKDAGLRKTYGINARQRIEKHFHIEDTITQTAQLFEDTLNHSRT